MYVDSLNLGRIVPNCPQIRPAITLSVVPKVFGYTLETVTATKRVLKKIHNIVSSTACTSASEIALFFFVVVLLYVREVSRTLS